MYEQIHGLDGHRIGRGSDLRTSTGCIDLRLSFHPAGAHRLGSADAEVSRL